MRSSLKVFLFCLLLLAVCGSYCAPAEETKGSGINKDLPFPVKDGMVWVFVGDSLTEPNHYDFTHVAYIESFYHLMFPKFKLHFRNSGRSGDQLILAVNAYDYRVSIYRPDFVSVELAHNGPAIKKEWADQLIQFGKLTEAIGAQPVFMGIHPEYEKMTKMFAAKKPVQLTQLETDRMKLLINVVATPNHWRWIDQSGGLFPYFKKNIEAANPVDLRWGKWNAVRGGGIDLVHPGPTFNLCKAYIILRDLKAPVDVSSAELDAAAGKVIAEKDCRISNLMKTGKGLSFTRLDERLPMACEDLAHNAVDLIPGIKDLNKYILKVNGLEPGKYEVLIDGVSSAEVDASELASGWNMFLMKKGPIHDQLLKVLKFIKDKEGFQVNEANTVQRVRTAATKKFEKDIKGKELVESMRTDVDALLKRDELIREAAQPQPRKFELRPAK